MLASSTPPDSRDATGHGSPDPNRNTLARAATAIASSASAMPLPAGTDRPDLRIQRDSTSREMHPDQLCPLSEPTQPATNRVRVHPEP